MNYLFNQILIIFIIIFLNFFKTPCDIIKFSVLDMIHTKILLVIKYQVKIIMINIHQTYDFYQ